MSKIENKIKLKIYKTSSVKYKVDILKSSSLKFRKICKVRTIKIKIKKKQRIKKFRLKP